MSSTTRRGAVLAALIAVLAGCGGAQSRFTAHMARGQEYYASGDFLKAGIEFRNAMQIEPHDIGAQLMAAHTAEQLGQFRAAFSLYQYVIDHAGDNLDARASAGRLLVTSHDADQALATIKPALAAHPDSARLLAVRAAARFEKGDAAGARADADRALQLDPKSEDAIELRAGLYQQDHDLDGAIRLVSGAVPLLPKSTPLRTVLISLYQAAKQPQKAEAQYRALIALKPQELRYRYELARFYSFAGRLDDAQHVLEDAVKALPTSDDAKLMLADFLTQQRGAAQGEQALRRFVAQQPDDYALQLGLGAMLQRIAQSAKAVEVYQAVVRSASDDDPAGITARDRLAAIALSQRHEDEARTLIGQVLARNPRDSDALLMRAQLALAHNDTAGAISDLRAVMRDQPRNALLNQLLARALVAHGDLALAEEPLRTALEVRADPSTAAELARLLIRLQRPEQAVTVLTAAIQRSPKDPSVREALVDAYQARGDSVAARKAAEDFQQVLPDSAAAYFVGGRVAEADKRFDDALRQYQKALALQPKGFDVLAALVHLQVQQGQGDAAVARIRALLAQSPKDPLLQNLLGDVSLLRKDFPTASDASQRAIALAPKWWAPYRNLGLAKLGAGDVQGAVKAYEEGLRAAPHQVPLLADLANLYQHLGRIDDAIAMYDDWVRQDPQAQLPANNLAVLLVTYRTDKASLDQALSLSAPFASSSNGNLLDTNGWVHFKRAEYTDALSSLQRAVDIAPDSPEFRYHLGMAELRAGQVARARSDLQAALKGQGRFFGADDARTALASLGGRSG